MEGEQDMLKSHEELIHGNILPRLDVMEKEHKAFREEVTTMKADLMGVQRGQAQLEVTVMKDGQLNREIMTENKELTNRLLTHVLNKDEKESQAEIEEKKAEQQSKIEARKAKWEIIGKVTVVLAGSGSILYGFFELFKDKF